MQDVQESGCVRGEIVIKHAEVSWFHEGAEQFGILWVNIRTEVAGVVWGALRLVFLGFSMRNFERAAREAYDAGGRGKSGGDHISL